MSYLKDWFQLAITDAGGDPERWLDCYAWAFGTRETHTIPMEEYPARYNARHGGGEMQPGQAIWTGLNIIARAWMKAGAP